MSVYRTIKFRWAGPDLTKPDPADPATIKLKVLDGVIIKEELCRFKLGSSFYCEFRGEIVGLGNDMDLNKIRLEYGVDWDVFCELATVLIERPDLHLATGMF
jgi:hypothetical protein